MVKSPLPRSPAPQGLLPMPTIQPPAPPEPVPRLPLPLIILPSLLPASPARAPGRRLPPTPDDKLFRLPRGAMLMPDDSALSLTPPLPVPMPAVTRTTPAALPSSPPAPDDKIFRSPRGGLTSVPIATPLRAVPMPRPPPWPDITDTDTLLMSVVPPGASDSAASVALNTIRRACQGLRCYIKRMRRTFQVF
jgi:hypothetical protein